MDATVIGEGGEAGRLMRRAALAAVAVAASLAVLKAAAWWWTDSVAMLASFADSSLDLLASGLNAYAIRHALAPADREHRFGHGKAEAVAGLAQAALVGGSLAFLGIQSIHRISDPEPLAYEAWGIGVMVVSMAATLALTLYQRRAVKGSGSLAVAADRLHYQSDLIANAAVIVALVLSDWVGWHWADGAIGLAIAATIGWSAWTILRQSLDQLIDRELPENQRVRIREIARAFPDVRGVHELRTRASGTDIFVQLHLVLDAGLTLIAAHEIADRVEAAIVAEFPNAEVFIHEDPHGIEEHHRLFAPARG